ncbi:hypothetical protein [Streptomyces flaveolus]|uniref:hypothetical protein n=1 Tax=Streptomyces flaveolus TaxID=67297 RepID=UPI0033EB34A1
MKSPREMVEMQDRIDKDRIAFRKLYVTLRASGFKYPESNSFLGAAKSLIDLENGRRRPLGWGKSDPHLWREFVSLHRREERLRQTASFNLSALVRRVSADRTPNDPLVKYLDNELVRYISTPDREKELYRARRDWGREIISRAKNVIVSGAGNQILDIAKSGGQSMSLTLHVHNPGYRRGEPKDGAVAIGMKAALVHHFGAGNCEDQNSWVVAEAYKLMHGTWVTLVADDIDHAYVMVGLPGPEAMYLDVWPDKATVANEKLYGLKHGPGTSILFSGIADKRRDLRTEGLAYLGRLPYPPPRLPAIGLQEAIEYAWKHQNYPHYVKYITTATEDGRHNSDSEGDGHNYGHTMSREAFSANASNGFRIQDGSQATSGPGSSAMSRIASMRPNDFSSAPRPPATAPTPYKHVRFSSRDRHIPN